MAQKLGPDLFPVGFARFPAFVKTRAEKVVDETRGPRDKTWIMDCSNQIMNQVLFEAAKRKESVGGC